MGQQSTWARIDELKGQIIRIDERYQAELHAIRMRHNNAILVQRTLQSELDDLMERLKAEIAPMCTELRRLETDRYPDISTPAYDRFRAVVEVRVRGHANTRMRQRVAA